MKAFRQVGDKESKSEPLFVLKHCDLDFDSLIQKSLGNIIHAVDMCKFSERWVIYKASHGADTVCQRTLSLTSDCSTKKSIGTLHDWNTDNSQLPMKRQLLKSTIPVTCEKMQPSVPDQKMSKDHIKN